MINSKAVGGVVIGIIIVIVAAYTLNQEQSSVSNEIPIEPTQDSSVPDSATLTQNNQNYEIDEEGNKRYVISVSDSPVVTP